MLVVLLLIYLAIAFEFIGISQRYLIFYECDLYKHFYKFNDVLNLEENVVEKINTDIWLEDIGTCFPFAEI